MDRATFQRWLDDYVRAWRSYDADAIGALFTEDAVYRFHAWDDADEAVHGRAAIVANWLEERDGPDSWSAAYDAWAVDGDRAVAVGVTRYLEAGGAAIESEFHNVFLCRFDELDRCREFTEVYAPRPLASR